jgi:hypothetical protein
MFQRCILRPSSGRGGTHLCNVYILPRDYMGLHPRSLPYLCLLEHGSDTSRITDVSHTLSQTFPKFIAFIHFPLGSQLKHRAPFGVSVITHTITVRITGENPARNAIYANAQDFAASDELLLAILKAFIP